MLGESLRAARRSGFAESVGNIRGMIRRWSFWGLHPFHIRIQTDLQLAMYAGPVMHQPLVVYWQLALWQSILYGSESS